MREWLLENQENYLYGIPKVASNPPWLFVVDLSKTAKDVTISAIEKGLRLDNYRVYPSFEELIKEFHGRVAFAKALVFVTSNPPSDDFPLFAVDNFRGNPCIWINSLDDSEISKRRFWNLLKELKNYAS